MELSEDRCELLKAAFEIVLDSDSQVYNVLTWIAQCQFVLEFDITKIQSNDMLVDSFGASVQGLFNCDAILLCCLTLTTSHGIF